MQNAVHRNVTAATDALARALRRVNFFEVVAEIEGIETLAPEQFLSEVMDDISAASASIRRISKHLTCEHSPTAQA